MNDLEKREFSGLPVPMLSPSFPSAQYRKGIFPIITNSIENKKKEQIAKAKKLEADIAEEELRAFKAKCQMMSWFLLQGQAIETERQSMKNQNAMEQSAITAQNIANMKANEELKLIQQEVKRMELELQRTMKELEDGLADNQNGDN